MIRLLVDSSADFSKAEIEEKKLLFVPLQSTVYKGLHRVTV